MAKLQRVAGATSQILQVFIQDKTSTTGAGLTGLVFNTATITAYYHRDTDTTATVMVLVTMTVGTFTSLGFKEIDATNMPGWYQFCPPNAAMASGAKSVGFHLKGGGNMADLPIEIELTGTDNQDAVHGGMTALPNAVAGASGGVLISGSNAGTTTLGALTVTGSMTVSDGLLVSRSSANASAITATGNGTGSGIVATSGSGATGDGVQMTAASTNGNGVSHLGAGTGHGFKSTGGSTSGDGVRVTGGGTGHGLEAVSGSGATGAGIQATSSATNGDGINCSGNGTGSGLNGSGGATNGNGILAVAQGTGIGIYAKGGSGASGAGIVAQGTGTNSHGLQTIATGSGDGIHSAGGGSGVDIRGNITGNLVGTVSTLTTYTGNTVQTGDSFARLGAPAGASVSADVAAINTKTTNLPAAPASTTNITGGTITTTTNVTNAPTAGDFTATMKASIGTAVAASAVASVTAAVAITSNNKKNQALAKFQFLMTDSTTHNPATGKTVTVTRSIDNGAYGAGTLSAVTEIGNGMYSVDFASGDLNGNVIVLQATASGADTTFERIVTQP